MNLVKGLHLHREEERIVKPDPRSFTELVKKSGLGLADKTLQSLMDQGIADQFFPLPDHLGSVYELFEIRPLPGENFYSSRQGVQQVCAADCRPANAHELLLWPDWDQETSVVALGSPVEIYEKSRVLMKCKLESGPALMLGLGNISWHLGFRVLGVRDR